MKLRARLAVTTIAVSVPILGALLGVNWYTQRRAAERDLFNFVTSRVELPEEQARCEAQPQLWRGGRPRAQEDLPQDKPRGRDELPRKPKGEPPPGRTHRESARLYVYDDALTPAQPKAPALLARDVEALGDAEFLALSSSWLDGEVQILLRTSWSGACSFVLATSSSQPWLGSILLSTPVWLLPMLALWFGVLVAIGPAVRRIRRLTEEVSASAASGYQAPPPTEGDDELATLARAFERAGQEVRARLEEKDQREQALRHFVANTTHDVMIPLTVLQGHLVSLQGSYSAESVSAAMQEAHYMASLIHNLSVMAKLDAQEEAQLQRMPVDLGALVLRVCARHKPIAKQLGVLLERALPEERLLTNGDVTMLEQAVSNLVYNAIRYNKEGGHVAVVLEPAAAGRFRLQVIDDGPGISPEDLEKILARGFRGNDARTRAPEGQGLGLSIAQRVSALHQLKLSLRASEYGGLLAELEGELRETSA